MSEDQLGTMERAYPHHSPTQTAIELLRASWTDYQTWKRRSQFTQDHKFLGGAKEIAQAGVTCRASIEAYLYALTLHDLDKAVRTGEITEANKHVAEQIAQTWENEKTQKQDFTSEKLDPYQMGYQNGFDDGFNHKAQNARPSILKATISASYREKFGKGYKDGHYAGVREARANERKRMRQLDRDKDRER